MIIYEGPSILDGAPIAVIATFGSRNPKTGTMIQTYIIRTDMSPMEASKAGKDSSVCGSCIHRHSLGGGCYVTLFHAPLSIYKAYKRGSYKSLQDDPKLIKKFYKANIRAGSYGDPAAVPVHVWQQLKDVSSGWTGYTHQMKHKRFDAAILGAFYGQEMRQAQDEGRIQDLKFDPDAAILDYAMVSADTPKQALSYHAKGLKTFRVSVEGAPILPNEIECSNTSEEGLTCAQCLKCDGASHKGKNIVITVHGTRSKRYTDKYTTANLIAVGG